MPHAERPHRPGAGDVPVRQVRVAGRHAGLRGRPQRHRAGVDGGGHHPDRDGGGEQRHPRVDPGLQRRLAGHHGAERRPDGDRHRLWDFGHEGGDRVVRPRGDHPHGAGPDLPRGRRPPRGAADGPPHRRRGRGVCRRDDLHAPLHRVVPADGVHVQQLQHRRDRHHVGGREHHSRRLAVHHQGPAHLRDHGLQLLRRLPLPSGDHRRRQRRLALGSVWAAGAAGRVRRRGLRHVGQKEVRAAKGLYVARLRLLLPPQPLHGPREPPSIHPPSVHGPVRPGPHAAPPYGPRPHTGYEPQPDPMPGTQLPQAVTVTGTEFPETQVRRCTHLLTHPHPHAHPHRHTHTHTHTETQWCICAHKPRGRGHQRMPLNSTVPTLSLFPGFGVLGVPTESGRTSNCWSDQ
mmetsp:Transcript_25835/g.41064  ORF Transcript_25835/g.41064 Transcript_25835/m.41064 type:complete len:403 (-) Transcript_25835:715-1923(-)